MSIRKKVSETLAKNDEGLLISRNDLIAIFGEDYETFEISYSARFSCFLFQEENEVYVLNVLKDRYVPIALIREKSTGKCCNPMTTNMLSVLEGHHHRCAQIVKSDPDNVFAKKRLVYFESILSHPKLRLKHLFSSY